MPIGTQIVTLVEAKVLNKNRFQPRGVVGVVHWQPQDGTHSYIVKFPNGENCALKRHEFAVRKQFQNEPVSDSSNEFDLHSFVIYRCVVGSRAFGLDDENSETRIGAEFICCPPPITGRCTASRNNLRISERRNVIGSCKNPSFLPSKSIRTL